MQRLDRDDLVRIDMRGAIDRAHRARAELLLHEVAGDDLTDEVRVQARLGLADPEARPLPVDERVAAVLRHPIRIRCAAMKRVAVVMMTMIACSSKSDTPAAPDDKPVELVAKDLGKAGDKWKGWTAKGPADADVMGDLGGVRIVPKKVTPFDLGFQMRADDLKALKDGIQKGTETANKTADAKVKVTFTTDTPDALEWTTEVGSFKTWGFHIHMNVGGTDFTCYAVTPRTSEANAKLVKSACASLAKK